MKKPRNGPEYHRMSKWVAFCGINKIFAIIFPFFLSFFHCHFVFVDIWLLMYFILFAHIIIFFFFFYCYCLCCYLCARKRTKADIRLERQKFLQNLSIKYFFCCWRFLYADCALLYIYSYTAANFLDRKSNMKPMTSNADVAFTFCHIVRNSWKTIIKPKECCKWNVFFWTSLKPLHQL